MMTYQSGQKKADLEKFFSFKDKEEGRKILERYKVRLVLTDDLAAEKYLTGLGLRKIFGSGSYGLYKKDL
jgi:hypothetical protein